MRSFTVSTAESGDTVLDVLRLRMGFSAAQARRLIAELRVRLAGTPCRDPFWRVRRGQRLELQEAKHGRPPSTEAKPQICYVDDQLVVVDKPPGLTTMRHPDEAAEFGSRGSRFLPPTLADQLPPLLAQRVKGKPGRVWAVHRLDKDTSGLVVFARSKAAERHLGNQFRAHTIERSYLAIVRGRARSARIESSLAADRGDARRGSTKQPGQGKRAVTHVRVLEELGDYTLVECRLETGRTHQVRIHLGEAGTPLCGERVYDRPLHGKPVPDRSAAPRLALHAALLGVTHPASGRMMQWRSSLPKDLKTLLDRLRKLAGAARQGPDSGAQVKTRR